MNSLIIKKVEKINNDGGYQYPFKLLKSSPDKKEYFEKIKEAIKYSNENDVNKDKNGNVIIVIDLDLVRELVEENKIKHHAANVFYIDNFNAILRARNLSLEMFENQIRIIEKLSKEISKS